MSESIWETISIERDARGVATLWLDRAEKHNALSARMIAELTEAAQGLGADPSVRVVVLAAKGRTFCAGGDLGWMREQMAADAAQRAEEATKLAMMLKALNDLPKPLIGRVQGNCLGGGVGMVAVCDVAVGTPRVSMALTEVRLGLIPATIGPYVVARMGAAKARRVFFSGRRFGAEEAVALNLLAKVAGREAAEEVAAGGAGDSESGRSGAASEAAQAEIEAAITAAMDAALDAAVAAEVAPYLEAAPEAVARAKALIGALERLDGEDGVMYSVKELVRCWEGEEAGEGIAAFFAREKPRWQS